MGQHALTHLLKMLEQIAANFAWDDDVDRAAAAVAAHLRRFWAPEMRRQLSEAHARGLVELSPLARAAVALL
jgi:formate dehydrogenase subunit delta